MWLSHPPRQQQRLIRAAENLRTGGETHAILNGGLIWYRLAGRHLPFHGFCGIFHMRGTRRRAETHFADLTGSGASGTLAQTDSGAFSPPRKGDRS